MKLINRYLPNAPLIALLAANTIPLWGVAFLNWDAFVIVALYWSENLIIGFYNTLKIAFARPANAPHIVTHLSKLFLIPFFIIHYGGFTAIHGLFILLIFQKGEGSLMTGKAWPCVFIFVQMLFGVIKQMISVIPSIARPAILALFVSHGISFVYNYLLNGEFASAKPSQLMGAPYSRVIVMHISILAGGFLLVAIGSPVALLLMLVVLKTIVDIKFHLREHRKKR